MFKAGEKYAAKLTDATVTTTKAGAPQVRLTFRADDGEGNYDQFDYYGSFSPKAEAITIKALVAAGFIGEDTTTELLSNTAMYQPMKDTVVELEADNKGKLRVKWVNTKQESKFAYKGAMPSLKGALAKARQEMGAAKPKSTTDAW